jgi:hypothetical protein
MKEIFKGAALSATLRAGPFQNFYQGLLDRGMKPELARVTLARKIAAVTLTLWKKGARFDAGLCEATSSLSVNRRSRPLLRFSWPLVAFRFSRRSGSRVSIDLLVRHLRVLSVSTEVSISILCPLAQPDKAIGLESHIGSWLACCLEPAVLLAQPHEPRASNHHRKHETDDI